MASSRVGGDVDYSVHGIGYATQRQPDPRIAAMIHEALGPAQTVLNVGAGTGSYEPEDRVVIAVEPSATMRSQRPLHLAPAIDAYAESLPLDDQSVDAAMASVTVHQWSDLEKGISELKRVTCGPIVILTFDGDLLDRFWLAQYVPELMEAERKRYPKIAHLSQLLGGKVSVRPVPIPIDCTDGFTEAFYARPEKFLDENVRRSQSAWTFVEPKAIDRGLAKLADDLRTGRWSEVDGELSIQPTFEGSLTLVVSDHRSGS
ncbi:MAG: methyltransferase domain-containing protein [Armatimonadetes bacterium]|nr:methyltransferase domain-containing protein [Armatimonadota bacterium]